MTTTQGTPLQPDFRERAKSNDVAVARLIGFEEKEIAEGRSYGHLLSRASACKSHGDATWRDSVRHCGRRDGNGIRKALLRRRNPSPPSS